MALDLGSLLKKFFPQDEDDKPLPQDPHLEDRMFYKPKKELKATPKKQRIIDFAQSLNQTHDYSSTELIREMAHYGITPNNILGDYLARWHVLRGFSVNTPKGRVKLYFEKKKDDDSYYARLKKI